MMPDLGKYAVEVLGAYAATISILVVLVLMSIAQSRKTSRALAAAEAERSDG